MSSHSLGDDDVVLVVANEVEVLVLGDCLESEKGSRGLKILPPARPFTTVNPPTISSGSSNRRDGDEEDNGPRLGR